MIDRASSAAEPEAERLRGRLLFGGLLLLALVATGILVFTDSAQWLRVAVLAGLWAALLGALVAAKYRGQSGARDNEVADLRELYELELERECAARREFELELEARSEPSSSEEHTRQMTELRAELTALRTQLEALLGGEVLVERLSLAQATRMRALEGQGDRAQRSITAGPVVESSRLDSGTRQPNGSAGPVAYPGNGANGSANGSANGANGARNGAQNGTQNGRRTVRAEPVAEPPRSREPERGAARRNPAAAQEATEYWQPFGAGTPAVPERPAERRPGWDTDAELPRRQPGTAGAPSRPARQNGAGKLDPNWTPSWETEDGLQWPSSSQSMHPQRSDAAREPAPRRQEPARRQPPRELPPERRPVAEAPLEPEPRREPERARRAEPAPDLSATAERTSRHPAPDAGGRRRRPDRAEAPAVADQRTQYQQPVHPPQYEPPAGQRHQTQEPPGRHGAADSGGRRRRPDEQPAAPLPQAAIPQAPVPQAPVPPAPQAPPAAESGGGRRRKPEEYADPEFSTGFTIRRPEPANGARHNGSAANGSAPNGSAPNGGAHHSPVPNSPVHSGAASQHGNGQYADEQRDEPAGTSSRGSHTQGLSVSELLAAHGNSGGGRRRRRED